jgi:hypothetical protein
VDRRLVLVVGIGRSGTSAFTGALAALGYAVPQPEVTADETNPRGFGEPQWLVDFQTPLLRRRQVANFDGRPGAFAALADATAKDDVVERLRQWLDGELTRTPRLVVKDPRTVWLLPLWQRATELTGTPPTFVTLLRHPAEVVASARRSYGEGRSDAARLAGWINVMLRTEEKTRGAARGFVTYDALLADWRRELGRLDSELGLGLDLAAGGAAVDGFLDPSLRRVSTGWSDVDAPVALRDLAEGVWGALDVESPVPGAAPADDLDDMRRDYDARYREAEQLTEWTVVAARARAKAAKKQKP